MKSRYGTKSSAAGTVIRTLSNSAVTTSSASCEQTNRPTYTSSPRSSSTSRGLANGSPSQATRIVYLFPLRSSWRMFAPAIGAMICVVSSPAARRTCSDVRPSPCRATSTYGESGSRLLRTITPILRWAIVPSPTNFARARIRKSPFIRFQAKWNSSCRVPHVGAGRRDRVPLVLRIVGWRSRRFSPARRRRGPRIGPAASVQRQHPAASRARPWSGSPQCKP